jgi:hypothetical protein
MDLVKQLPEIGVPTPKILGRQEDFLRTVLRISNPKIISLTSQTFKSLGVNPPTRIKMKNNLHITKKQPQRAKKSVMQSNAGVKLQFKFFNANVRPRQVCNSTM